MFEGLFEWVMGIITYVLSFFGIKISKPNVPSNEVVHNENVVEPTNALESSELSEPSASE